MPEDRGCPRRSSDDGMAINGPWERVGGERAQTLADTILVERSLMPARVLQRRQGTM